MRKRIQIVLILIFSLVLFSNCQQNENVVAKVGPQDITKDDFIKEMKRNFPGQTSFTEVDLKRKKDILNRLVRKKMKVAAAYDLNLEENEEIRMAVESQRERAIGDKYYEMIVIDKLVTKEEMDTYLSRQGVELKASHILIGYKEVNRSVERSEAEASALVEKLATELKNGEDFAELAKKHSDDPSAEKNSGQLGYFSWGRMVGPFQETAWNMEIGQISDPVKTRFGFHIIRLEDRRDMQNFQAADDPQSLKRIKRQLFQAKGEEGRITWETHFADLKKSYGYRIIFERINDIAEKINVELKEDNISGLDFSSDEKAFIFAEWNGGSISLDDVIKRFGPRFNKVIQRFRKPNALRKEVEGMSMLKLVVADAKKLGIQDDSQIIEDVNRFMEDKLAQLVEKKEVSDKVEISDEEALKYYQENADKFKKPAEMELWELFVTDEMLAKKLANRAQKEEFTTLAKKYSEDKGVASKGGYVGYRTIRSRADVTKKAFELGPGGKIGGPVKFRKGWTVFKTGDMHPEKIKSFEDVKSKAISLCRNENIRKNRTDWEKELEGKYAVNIYEEKLREI